MLIFLQLSNHLKMNSLRCYPRKPEDSIIEWDNDRDNIYALIRASSKPFSGAYTFLNGEKKIIIWEAELVKEYEDFIAIPGQVMFLDGGFPIVACKDKPLKLKKITFSDNSTCAINAVNSSLRNRLKSLSDK